MMSRWIGGIALLALFTGASQAATVEDLYQARTILTGQGEEGRPKGLAECLTDVLAKVSGDPKLLSDPRVAAMGSQAPSLIRGFRYRDRMEELPVHDEQGTRDRPYDLTADFYPDRIDAILRSLGSAPWGPDRPRLAMFIAVRNVAVSYVFADDKRRDNGQRDSILWTSYRTGMPVALPSDADLKAAGLDLETLWKAEPASLADATKTLNADLPLVGTMQFSDAARGWIADWRFAANGRTYRWQVRGVNYDEAFRSALRGAAQILSGHGEPG